MGYLCASAYIFILVLVSLIVAGAQVRQPPTGLASIIPEIPMTCEMNALFLDFLLEAIPEATKDNKAVIIISRLGKGETARRYHQRRFHNAFQYLSDKGKIRREKVIVTEGEPIANDYGRLEFYLNGEIKLALLFARNRDLCVDCCENRDPDYYPEKGRAKGKTRK